MKNLKYYITVTLISIVQVVVSQTKKEVSSFEKAIISPHIEVTFVEGNEEFVTIEESTEPEDKINIEVKGKTLRVYLDDAKETTKSRTVIKNGVKIKEPVYKGKVLTITVTYKKINELSIRGEQATLCKNKIVSEAFKLKIYGESQVVFNAVDFQEFSASVYGESTLEIKSGTIENQIIKAYGEGIINLLSIENEKTTLRAYGEAKFKIQSSKQIKFTAYGEAKLFHKGSAKVDRGLNIGDVEISRID